jgi:cyclophilin family peptidyl-prolyl cis-trans isomerase
MRRPLDGVPRLPAVFLVLAVAAAGCGGGTNGSATTEGTTGGYGVETVTETESAPAETAAVTAGGCRETAAPEARADGGASPPSVSLAPEKTYSLSFTTNCGTFVVTLDQQESPKTAASLVALARAGFYDGTVFHRIVPGFVIQGGDPTQTGTGGPGYQTVDTPPADAAYLKGVVAMAKTAAEAPGTSGSQFFVVTADDAPLPPEYAIVGRVTSGLAVVERIGLLGDADEQPTEPVVVEKVTVTEG